jgi:hypothetical protein
MCGDPRVVAVAVAMSFKLPFGNPGCGEPECPLVGRATAAWRLLRAGYGSGNRNGIEI